MVNTPLSTIQESIERSLYHALRKEVVKKGYLPDITQYDVTNSVPETTRYENDIKALRLSMGFAIEVFNHSGTDDKDLKKVPRIVLVPNMTLPGALGGSPDRIYEGNGDPLSERGFTASILPPQTTDFYYDVIAVYEKAKHGRILNGIIALALPQRGYIDLVDENADIIPNQKFFIRTSGNRQFSPSEQGLFEMNYTYEVPDIFEMENQVVSVDIKPITEITLITESPEGTDLTTTIID